MIFTLIDYCNYSLADLLKAAKIKNFKIKIYKNYMQSLSQNRLNEEIKKLCKQAKWYHKDIEKNGTTYTAFSPRIKIISRLESQSSCKLLEELKQTIFIKKNK